MKAPSRERPPLDFMGPYNVPRSEFPGEDVEIWAESDQVKEFTAEEFFEVREEIVTALSKHGKVYDDIKGDHDFFVYEDKFFDRTQKIELEPTDRLPKILPAAVIDLQRILRNRSLWRVMFIGHGQAPEKEFFVVYPDLVRIRQLENSNSLEAAVAANAEFRLASLRTRKEHQKQRKSDLKAAIAKAFAKLPESNTEVLLVAWFATSSVSDFDWGREGKPGTDVWILLPTSVPEDCRKVIKSDVPFSVYWTTPEGQLFEEHAPRKSANMRWLLHFVEDDNVRSGLSFKLAGKRFQFARP